MPDEARSKVAKQAKTTQAKGKRVRMDDEKLVDSRSPQTHPKKFSGDAAGTLAAGRRNSLHRPTDMISGLKRGEEVGSATFLSGGVKNVGGGKNTFFSLMDAVSELKCTEERYAAMDDPPGFGEDEPPPVNTKRQPASAKMFYSFEKRVETLDQVLRDFENASRELGSSIGIVSSAFRLQERLAKILYLFRENAVGLYPRKILRKPQEVFLNPYVRERRRARQNCPEIPLSQDNLEFDMLPSQLESFARDVGVFIRCLSEFQEFNDEAIVQSMRSFEADLRYFSSRLNEYSDQFQSPAVQRYVYDLMFEIGGHFDEITSTLTMFIEIGIPTIWFHQQHGASNLLNISMLSIVFGAMDASLLALSYDMTGNILANCVNVFWLSSLVFSIASGVNGFLGLTWKQSTYRSPVQRVPWWVLTWMKGSPLAFLVIAFVCFSIGIVLFTYSSEQGPVTSRVVLALSLALSSGLIFISGWFALERWTFVRQNDQKWLGEVISEVLEEFAGLGIVRAHRCAMQWCGQRLVATRTSFARLIAWLLNTRMFKVRLRKAPTTNAAADATVGEAIHLRSLTKPGEGPSDDIRLSGVRDPRVRFQNAVRAVIKLQRTTGSRPMPRPGVTRRDSWSQTSVSSDSVEFALKGEQLAKVAEELRALDMIQELSLHSALVRDLQFSPNGKYLATAGWDRKAMIFRVGETFTPHHTLVHVGGFVNQVTWSPNGHFLLTRFARGLKLWSEDGVCEQTIDRCQTASSVVWLPSGQAILSVEGNKVVKMDLQGEVLDTYHFDHVDVVNVAVTSDCTRLIAIGPCLPPGDRPQPTCRTRVEKKMIVYNMHTKQKESQSPLYYDVRDVVISKRMSVILVSFEQASPQLWKLEIIRDKGPPSVESAFTGRLHLKHTFTLNGPTTAVGACYFGGKDEQFVFCIGKAGDMHIWDRETAVPLRYVRPMSIPKLRDLTCIEWNNALDEPLMFATGSHDGKVRVWSTAVVVQDGASGSATVVE